MREEQHVADGVGTGEQHAHAVQAQSETAHRGRTKLEGLHEEAKLRLGALLGKAQKLEHGYRRRRPQSRP